jgi:hypothetical protein
MIFFSSLSSPDIVRTAMQGRALKAQIISHHPFFAALKPFRLAMQIPFQASSAFDSQRHSHPHLILLTTSSG